MVAFGQDLVNKRCLQVYEIQYIYYSIDASYQKLRLIGCVKALLLVNTIKRSWFKPPFFKLNMTKISNKYRSLYHI